MSDNASAYIYKGFATACRVIDLKHIHTRPYTPRTNGNAERFIQALWREWAYSMPFQNSDNDHLSSGLMSCLSAHVVRRTI